MPAYLTVESGNASPKMLELHQREIYRLGRHPDCQLFANDPHVSREHAQIESVQGVWKLTNLQAKNGTLLNGTRVKDQATLSQSDRIQIGSVELLFHERKPELSLLSPPLVPIELPDASRPQAGQNPSIHNTDVHQLSTLLQVSDLEVLLRFANSSLRDENPQTLVRNSLEVLARQTAADVIAYVPIDPEAIEQRVFWSRNNRTDLKVSRRLNQLTIESAARIWLEDQRKQGNVDSDSLRMVRDAICIPLFSRLPDCECLGTFHLYRLESSFETRQVHFAEAIGLSFSTAMRFLRDRLALQAENTRLREAPSNAGQLIGSSAAITSLRERIAHLARASFPVLILGEPGVGKELVAEMIHEQSNRGAYSLVRVDCGTLTGDRGEQELFGDAAHNDREFPPQRSFLSQAEMGGLLLDEVTRLSLPLQQKLLKLLESRPFATSFTEPSQRVDVRILATSSQDILREVREGRFLAELYHRFVGVLPVPALRDHPTDIPELVSFFLDLLNREYHTQATLEPAAIERLQRHSWPGNVRQLRSILEVAVANVGPMGVIHAEDLALSEERVVALDPPPSLNLAKLEEWAIKQALAQTEGNKSQAAKILGIHRETLGLKMKQYRLFES